MKANIVSSKDMLADLFVILERQNIHVCEVEIFPTDWELIKADGSKTEAAMLEEDKELWGAKITVRTPIEGVAEYVKVIGLERGWVTMAAFHSFKNVIEEVTV